MQLSFPIILHLFVLAIYRLRISYAISDFPSIKIVYAGKAWSNISANGTLSLYSPVGDDLQISCSASYPISWNISGIVMPPEIAKISHPKRNLAEGTFDITIHFFYGEAVGFPELKTSANIICQKVNDPQVLSKIAVFVQGKGILGSMKETVQDSKIIPCYTTEPTKQTRLYLNTAAGGETLVDDALYSPTHGFISSKYFEGEYICRKDSYSVRVTALLSDPALKKSEFEFSPSSTSIKVFLDEEVNLACLSKTTPIKLYFENQNQVGVEVVAKSELHQEAKVSPSIFLRPGSNQTAKGKVDCIINENGQVVTVKEWDIEFLATPEFYLDSFEREIDCISHLTPKRLETLRCKTTLDCKFLSRCLDDSTGCELKKKRLYSTDTDGVCFIDALNEVRACANIPASHLNGLARCTIDGKLSKMTEFFTSLDYIKYSNWQDASQTELVRLDDVPTILYTNESTEFFCTAVAYLFTSQLYFELEYKNGTKELLQTNGETVNVTRVFSESRRKIDEFNTLGKLSIFLPIDAVAVHCVAPWWNSTETFSVSKTFRTRHLFFPTIQTRGGNYTEKIIEGEKSRRLKCNARGEPQPNYHWFIKEENGSYRNALEKFSELKTSSGSCLEEYLEFPVAQKKYSGEYKCVAENELGSVEKVQRIEISDPPPTEMSWVYVSISIVTLIVLVVVVMALMVSLRRYKEAKELVRSLTDQEVSEFYNGKPELICSAQGKKHPGELCEFLPFKGEYEIPFDDIEFDKSESTYLGSGQFSYVVKGRIISREKPIALKISKPTAEVNVFKSILSEVKIMIYIGEHVNVLQLVGACTQDIKNRSIHIATEICENGSLEKFLRDARSSFVNLVNANQQIDTTLLPVQNERAKKKVSTLDLINFSAQIARGMEWLAYKNVVHADLAARNVLLTNQFIAKISDFGLSRKLYEGLNYVKKSKSPLPWRWMSPEALNTLTFSTHSDIWSYGATLYEIFTLGDVLYPDEQWCMEFVIRLTNGMRMGRPRYSTPEIYSNIMACWEMEPSHRSDFATLRTYFQQLLSKHQNTPPSPSKPSNAPSIISFAVNSPYLQLEVETEAIYANLRDIKGIHGNSGGASSGASQIANSCLSNSEEMLDDMEQNDKIPTYINIVPPTGASKSARR